MTILVMDFSLIDVEFCNKTSKSKTLYQMWDPETKSYQMEVRGLICVGLGVLDVNHRTRMK